MKSRVIILQYYTFVQIIPSLCSNQFDSCPRRSTFTLVQVNIQREIILEGRPYEFKNTKLSYC